MAYAASVVFAGAPGVQVVGAAIHRERIGTTFSKARAEEIGRLSGTEVWSEGVTAGVLAVVVLFVMCQSCAHCHRPPPLVNLQDIG